MLLVIGVTGHTGKYFLQELVKKQYKEKIRFLIRKESEEVISVSYTHLRAHET